MTAPASSGWRRRCPRRRRTLGGFSARTWVGFDPSTTYRLRRRGAAQAAARSTTGAVHAGAKRPGDELDDAFYATADQMSVAEAERFARALAR